MSKLVSRNINQLRSWCEDAELASAGIDRATEGDASIVPLQSHDSIGHRASDTHLLLRQRAKRYIGHS